MIVGSVCSGVGAPETAWHPLGWSSAFMSEIDPQACAVLRHHNPGVPLHGDFTTIQAGDYAAIDVLVGGTPCQSFSVAGLRGGMADGRGNLALEYLRLADRLRPRWVVWENVPGVLSSNEGRDFGAFLGGLAELGYGFAYRSLDAQFFHVPQRRERVFVVGYLGDWRRAAAVLFEPQSMRGDTPPSRETGEGVTGKAGSGVAGSFNAAFGQKLGLDNQHVDNGCPFFIAHTLRGEGFDASEGGTGRGTPLVPVAFDSRQDCVSSPDTLGSLGASSPQAQAIAGTSVRRLTPTECLRLQGFPDTHLNVLWKGKPLADGPRYRMIGNSMAVPVMRWIGQRIGRADVIAGRIAA